MDIFMQENNPSSLKTPTFLHTNISIPFQNENFINGNQNNENVFPVGPKLNISLNDVVDKFENTIILKKTPNKMKSNLSISLPNIFLPRLLDENKHYQSEKRIQWTNKLNFNLEKLKNAFRDTYNYLCNKKRSQSIPNLNKQSTEYFLAISPKLTHYGTQENKNCLRHSQSINISCPNNEIPTIKTDTKETIQGLINAHAVVCSVETNSINYTDSKSVQIPHKTEKTTTDNHNNEQNTLLLQIDVNKNIESTSKRKGRSKRKFDTSTFEELPQIKPEISVDLPLEESIEVSVKSQYYPSKRKSLRDSYTVERILENSESVTLETPSLCDVETPMIDIVTNESKELNENTTDDCIRHITELTNSDEQQCIRSTCLKPIKRALTNNMKISEDANSSTVYDVDKELHNVCEKKILIHESKLKHTKRSTALKLKTDKKICKDKMLPSNDVKPSKRDAAVRGFVHMVARSLNYTSQPSDTMVGRKNEFKEPLKSNLLKNGKSINARDKKSDAEETETTQQNRTENNKIRAQVNEQSSDEVMKYRKMRTNTYVDPKPSHWSQEVEKCACKPSKMKQEILDKASKSSSKRTSDIVWDCSNNCLNRLTYTECNAKTCPCGDLCKNQKIRKLDWAKGLKITKIESKGRGVITTKQIREGALITEYVGEVISEDTFEDRMINLYKEDAHHYCLHLDGEMLIDAYRSGSVARFVNHSCQPNCEMQKWMVNGCYRMCLFANETIEPNAELTYDYNFCSFNTNMTQVCSCGASNCRGFIGGRPSAEQSESQKDRKKLFYAFGRTLSGREKIFVRRHAIFLVRGRTLGRCKRLGIRRSRISQGGTFPSTNSEIKRRKAKKNQFLTQMSALNSVRSIKTRQLHNAQENENLTRTAQLGQVLRDLYNTLLEQKDPSSSDQQLVAPFLNVLKPKKYPEFYRMLPGNAIVSLNQIYSRLLDGTYGTMVAFDQDMLQLIGNIVHYAGKRSSVGKCAQRVLESYKDLKANAIALYEALTDELMTNDDKCCLLLNSITDTSTVNQSDNVCQPKTKRRKRASSSNFDNGKRKLERGAEIIKCVCGFLVEGGHVMVQCDRCYIWQHGYCMNIARQSVDAANLEPYFCHICMNIPPESLIIEIPRHNISVRDNMTLFWTLVNVDGAMLKIDDFVIIQSEHDTSSVSSAAAGKSKITDLSRRTVMRISNLWKDNNGQRWMEGGLFLRPYNNYLKETVATGVVNNQKSMIDFNTHKWHQKELIYTELTKVLPLDNCIGRCDVLSLCTFQLGRPILQASCGNDDVYLCDWFLNKTGEWKEIDSSYLKIKNERYCFEKFEKKVSNDEDDFYGVEDLLKLDQGCLELCKNNKAKSSLNDDEKILLKREKFGKLVNKLAEYANERIRKVPSSSPSSMSSRSTTSSRGTSPLSDNLGSKSPIMVQDECFLHCPRKQLLPKKNIISSGIENVNETTMNEINQSEEIIELKGERAPDRRKRKNITQEITNKKSIIKDSFCEIKKEDKNKHVKRLSRVLSNDKIGPKRYSRRLTYTSENVHEDSNNTNNIISGISLSIPIIETPLLHNQRIKTRTGNDFSSIENMSSN